MSNCQQQTFLNSSIKSYSINIGYNTQSSSLTCQLVDDVDNSDNFNPPAIGTPVFFSFVNTETNFNFKFGGLLSNWTRLEDENNFPAYEVTVTDPRAILENVQLITNNYNGTVIGISNLINVYGYLENISFGSAQTNSGGIPFNRVLAALTAMGTGPQPYSGGILFQGEGYSINLSNLPIVPDFYRIPGQGISLLSAIDTVCREAGFDYYVELTDEQVNGNYVIDILTVGRTVQPRIDVLRDFITANCTTVKQAQAGAELRNEVTSAFVVGGPVDRLWQAIASDPGVVQPENEIIWPYWGLNEFGNAIVSDIDLRDLTFEGDTKTVTIDARGLNVHGVGRTYTMSLGEMRAALAGYESWSSYVSAAEPAKAAAVGLEGVWGGRLAINAKLLNKIVDGKASIRDWQNWRKPVAVQRANRNFEEEVVKNTERLFSVVSSYINEFYGRRFMVRIPFVLGALESETDRVITSYEPTDSGWPESSVEESLLEGLGIFKHLFQNDQGKYECFVRFDSPQDFERYEGHSQETMFWIGDKVYVRCTVDPQLVYLNRNTLESPRVVITLASPLLHKIDRDIGFPAQLAGLARVLNKAVKDHLEGADGFIRQPGVNGNLVLDDKGNKLNAKDFIKFKRKQILNSLNHLQGGNLFVGLSERPFYPDQALVPLRSNVLKYGPWFALGSPGKVEYEQDDSLVPWNYNGFTALNIAGNAKVEDRITNMVVGELGSVTVVGAPNVNAGRQLIAGGPNTTGISVTVGREGSTTTYRFRTYSPKFGSFNKSLIDSMQRLSRAFLQFDRNMRATALLNNLSANRGGIGQFRRNFIVNEGPEAIKKGTPHDYITSISLPTSGAGDNEVFETAVSQMSGPEAIAATNAHSGEVYRRTSLMSMDGLYRGFSTDSGNLEMPHFEYPNSTASPNLHDLNPFSGDATSPDIDINVIAHGDEYPESGIRLLEGYDPLTARPVALRGPLVIASWGRDTAGNPVPASSGDPTKYLGGYKTKSHKWKVGPLNIQWDNDAKLWQAGGTIVKVGVVVAHSGNMHDIMNTTLVKVGSGSQGPVGIVAGVAKPKPRYVVRPVNSIASGGIPVYHDPSISGLFSDGTSDLFCHNLQEGKGHIHTVGIGSPVLYYTANGSTFFNELPRSFVRRDGIS